MTCGFETVNILIPNTLKYVFILGENNGVRKLIDVSTIFVSSEPLCPIVDHTIWMNLGGQRVLFSTTGYKNLMFIDNLKYLTVATKTPFHLTIEIKANTLAANLVNINYKQIEIKVCG